MSQEEGAQNLRGNQMIARDIRNAAVDCKEPHALLPDIPVQHGGPGIITPDRSRNLVIFNDVFEGDKEVRAWVAGGKRARILRHLHVPHILREKERKRRFDGFAAVPVVVQQHENGFLHKGSSIFTSVCRNHPVSFALFPPELLCGRLIEETDGGR